MTPERLDLIRDLIDHTGYAQWKHTTADLLDEVDRLREGIESLTRTGYDHTSDCEKGCSRDGPSWHPDCGKCWEDSLYDLLNPTEGEDQAHRIEQGE